MQGSATTSLDVLNLALSTLGKDHCDSFDPKLGIEPESVEGKKVARLFNKAIDDVQREFYWHELIAAKAMSADAKKSHDGRYRYPLPDDCIRPLGVRLPSDGETLVPTAYTRLVAQDSEYDYDIEGGFLLTGINARSLGPDAMVVEDAGVEDSIGLYLPGKTDSMPYTPSGGGATSYQPEWPGYVLKVIEDELNFVIEGDVEGEATLSKVEVNESKELLYSGSSGNWTSENNSYSPAPTVRRATWADIDAEGIDRSTVPVSEVFDENEVKAEIVYLRRAASPADWTSELLDCIVAKLAADAALSVTGEYRLTQALKQDYRMTIRSEAKRLQSKYKTNETRMPRGFGAWRANRG